MKFNQVVIPHLNVNDIECTVVDLICEDGSIIEKNDIICIIETTKASVEITSDFEGYIQFELDQWRDQGPNIFGSG